jgi:hypothetical protein
VTVGSIIVVVLGIVAVAALIGWFLFRRNEPEDAASHGTPDRIGSDLYYGDVNDRPGSPGAEADGVAGPGEPVPGPSAEADPRP